ncbi:MAG TPA: YXWGXW repeat-containing protein [Polyangiaceae bacterium]|jgi:hypothetical protein|nr:YXWGXW repeat-containing protein [Polyangiaceae bacterium]
MTNRRRMSWFSALKRLLALSLMVGSAPGCVIGRSARASSPESARGPSAAPVNGSPVVPQSSPQDGADAPPAPPSPSAVWLRGYWHWDGVRYVWEHGRWESSAAPATGP